MQKERRFWNTRTAFLLAAIGSAVGLGNLWRFPYVAYENGGGAFLVPYFIALLTTGIPILIAEYMLGKRSRAGAPDAIAKVNPRWEWVGWFAGFVSFGIVVYYMAVMAWSWLYTLKAPWTPWAGNEEGFFFNEVLRISDGPLQLGGLVWPLVAGVLVSWILCFFIIRKGPDSVSKVVKWTVPIPYLLLLVLLIHGIAQPGALEGLAFYLTPNFDVLKDASVWLAAYGQIFFSLSLGAGIMIAYASYLKRNEDVSWQAAVAGLANSATEFFAGFIVFSVLGAVAAVLSVPVSEVAAGGPGLAFVAFPMALANLPLSGFFSFIFFLTLLTLGIDSAFSLIEATVTGLSDRLKKSHEQVLLAVCAVGFVLSLLFVTQAGLYWLDIVDHWMNSYGLVLVGLLEAVIVAYMIGTRKFKEEINEHTIRPVGAFWEFSLKYITPIALTITLLLAFKAELAAPYEGYPMKALLIGGWGVWLFFLFLSMFLQRDESKYHFILGLALLVITVWLGVTQSAALAMGIVGTVILGGGLLHLFRLDKRAS